MDLIQITDLDEYQRLAEATMNPEFDYKGRLGNTALGLCDESFELFELFHYRRSSDERSPIVYESPPYGGQKARDIVDELGDVMWYAAVLVDSLGGKLSEVCHDMFFVTPWNEAEGPVDAPAVGDTFYTAWADICLSAAKIGGLVKKHIYQGHDMDDEKIRTIYDYVVKVVSGVRTMAAINKSTVSEVCCFNITKLRQRYPGGEFSTEASVNRTV